MASDKMTEYERQRQENINRNFQMLSSLKVHSHLSDLRSTEPERKKRKYEKRPVKPLEGASRSSLRTQGIPPHFSGLPESLRTPKADTRAQETVNHAESLNMRDVYIGQGSHRTLVDTFTSLKSVGTSFDHASSINVERVKAEKCIDFDSFKLEPWHVARVVSNNINAVRFLPTAAMTMVVVGNRNGELGFWNVGKGNEGDEAIHLYRPHADSISGISVHPFALSKVYTSSHDGLLKLMNSEREEFDLLYASTSRSSLYSVLQPPNEPNSLYVGEGLGLLNVFDERTRKIVSSWGLHEQRINTIDVCPTNPNIIATASTDGHTCLWDLRKINVENGNCKALRKLNLRRSALSAYFSPSGSHLASSVDGYVSVLYGANFENKCKMYERDRSLCGSTTRCPRAVWCWDDNHIFMGDSKKSINILSVRERKIVYSCKSSLMPVTSRYDTHPYNVGMMAAATLGGSVYVWTAATAELC